MLQKSRARILIYALSVILNFSCGSPLSTKKSSKAKSSPVTRRTVRLEYAASLEPYLDSKGFLILPGQKLDRWSGKSFIGSSRYDLVPID